MEIAVLGTGIMGSSISRRLLATGATVTVWNRTWRKTEPLAEEGATVAPSPGEAVADAEIVFTVLRDAAAVASVLFASDNGPDLGGRCVVQSSTIAPDEARELAGRVEARGGRFVDGPVLGSRREASEGALQVLVGASDGDLESARPALDPLGTVLHVGAIGSGSALKLAMNLMIAMEITAFATALRLVEGSGISVDRFVETLRASKLHAPTYDAKLPRLVERRFDDPNFPAELLAKDVDLIRSTLSEHDLEAAPLDGIRAILDRTLARGHGAEDYSALLHGIDRQRE